MKIKLEVVTNFSLMVSATSQPLHNRKMFNFCNFNQQMHTIVIFYTINIFNSIKFLCVSDLTGPSSEYLSTTSQWKNVCLNY
jgi:hypothetical protein